MKWIVLTAAAVVNCVGVFLALAPVFLTFAELPPKSISCGLCNVPEVASALAAAASYGRGQITGLIQMSAVWLMSIALFNVAALAFVLFTRVSPNKH